MITINATGDTTLYTSGKYCTEDILVKVPASGGGSGGGIETCTVTINYAYNSISQLAYMDVNTGQYNVLYDLNTGSTTIKCVCGSLIYLYMHSSMMGKSFNNLTELFGNTNICVLGIDATNNGIATIDLATSAGGGAGGS